MGFVVSPSLVQQQPSVTGTTVTMPPGALPGDVIWVFIGGQLSVTAFPAGWTRLGSETAWSALPNNAAAHASIWTHTFALGDPTSITITGGTNNVYCAAIIRCSTTPTVHTDTSSSGTGTTLDVGVFSPAVPAGDLRLWCLWHHDGGSPQQTVSTLPAVTPSAINPSGTRLQSLAVSNANNPAATSGSVSVFQSFTDTGADGSLGAASLSLTDDWFQRSICLTDGSSVSDQIATGIQGSAAAGLDSAKGRYVGGARLL